MQQWPRVAVGEYKRTVGFAAAAAVAAAAVATAAGTAAGTA
jgi:hypothetical protein